MGLSRYTAVGRAFLPTPSLSVVISAILASTEGDLSLIQGPAACGSLGNEGMGARTATVASIWPLNTVAELVVISPTA